MKSMTPAVKTIGNPALFARSFTAGSKQEVIQISSCYMIQQQPTQKGKKKKLKEQTKIYY